MQRLCNEPMKIAVIGDQMISPDTMEEALQASKIQVAEVVKFFWGTGDPDDHAARQLKVERGGPDAVPYPEGLDDVIEDIDLIMTHFCPIPEKLLKKAKNLKAIMASRGGVENVCVEAATKMNIPVINVIRNAEPVADFALGMMLSITRGIAQSYYEIRNGKWEKEFFNASYVRTLNSYKVGLIGFGNIGSAIARRLVALEVPVIVYDEYVNKEELKKKFPTIEIADELDTLLADADIVSVHLRLTESTTRFFNMDIFKKMKKESYFINTARGGLVDENDLVKALQEGVIGGAALDVYDSEPIDFNSPLIGLDNVLLTSHIAGLTVDAIPRAPFMLMKEFDRMVDEGTYTRVVNFKDINL